MSLKERVYSILVVSSAENFNNSIFDLLPASHYRPKHIVKSISEAKRVLTERSFDFIFINSPLSDGSGINFAIDLSTICDTIVLMCVRSEIYESILDKVAEHGVFVLSKPTSKAFVTHAAEWMSIVRERIRTQESKTLSLEEKMEEIRTVNRAKLLLITEMNMDESHAHHYIEKQAMDRCVTKKHIAEEIINKYT